MAMAGQMLDDDFISNPTQYSDVDGDGYGDNQSVGATMSDAFPNDGTQWERYRWRWITATTRMAIKAINSPMIQLNGRILMMMDTPVETTPS